MKRRSRAGGDPVKRRRPKAPKLTRRNAPKIEIRSNLSPIAEEVARLTRERDAALEQQAATSEVVQVISNSPSDLEPVFVTMLEKAVRICDATFGNIYRWDGEFLSLVAAYNTPTAFAEARRLPRRPDAKMPIGRMLSTKAAVHVADLVADESYVEQRIPEVIAAVELGGARTFLAVPMLKDNELIGALSLSRLEVRPFTDKQIELVKNFAAQAVIAIENARLLNELRQRTDDLSQRTTDLTEALEQQTATSEVLQVISSSPGDLQPVFASMLRNAVRICDAQFGNIYRWDGEALRALASHNTPSAFAEARERISLRPGPKDPVARMIVTKQTVHTADVAASESYAEGEPLAIAAVELGGVRTLLTVPMLKDNELIGAFTLARHEVHPFNEQQIEWSRTSPRRPSSPSRTRGCSTNCDSEPLTLLNAQPTSRKH
jgi:GAF domain-containing protein